MIRATSASRRPLERGQFSWVTLVLLVGLVAGGYLGWIWAPIYYTHYEVKQVVRDFMNQAVKNRNDEHLVKRMCEKLARIEESGPSRPAGDEPPVQVEPREVTWERDTTVKPPTIHVAFEYTRTVVFPLLDRTEETTLAIDMSQDIDVPIWK